MGDYVAITAMIGNLVVIRPDLHLEHMENLFSVKESAKRLSNISPWTVYAWLSQGRLRKVKISSRSMIAESELQRFIDEAQSLAGSDSWRTV
jgi:hypothetical protein